MGNWEKRGGLIIKVTTKEQKHSPVGHIDPNHSALVIIDVQNDFCHSSGLLKRAGFEVSQVQATAEKIRLMLERARHFGVFTVFVRSVYHDEALSKNFEEICVHRNLPSRLCQAGSWGADWYNGIEPTDGPGEVSVTKHRFSAFLGTDFDLYLRSNNISTIIITGVNTGGSLDATLREGSFLDYRIVVPEDCTTDSIPGSHAGLIKNTGETFGDVLSSDDIYAEWAGASPDVERSWLPNAKRGRVLTELNTRIDPKHTALVLIDLQNDFCNSKGAMGALGEDLSAAQTILPAVKNLLTGARKSGVTVIHVKAEYGLDSASDVSLYSGNRVGATECCRPGSWGAEFVDEARPLDSEHVVVKHRFSPFPDTRLELLLRANGIRTVVVMGVATHCCVEATVRDACHKDFYVVVAKDCCATRGRMRHLHEASLETMGLYFATVVPSDEILDTWEIGTTA